MMNSRQGAKSSVPGTILILRIGDPMPFPQVSRVFPIVTGGVSSRHAGTAGQSHQNANDIVVDL